MAIEIRTVDYSSYPPAVIELRALNAIRDLAQRTLDGMAARPVTAAAFNPLDMLNQTIQAEYLATALSLWDEVNGMARGFGLSLLPMEQFYPLVSSAIQTSLNTFISSMSAIMQKQAEGTTVFGEYFFVPDYVSGTGTKPPNPYQIQFGDVRDILSDLGGGGTIDAPLATGITGGVTFGDVLSANGIAVPDKIWLYGETSRRVFNGHLQMDGLVFSDWDDPALTISPQDRWLRVDRYRPGDHWGCACIVVPYIPNFGAPTPITVSAIV
jgi:hypothetical protein